MANIKLTTIEGIDYPKDLQNLSYDNAILQLDLLSQNSGSEGFESDRQGEDVLCLNYTDGSFYLYEIEE